MNPEQIRIAVAEVCGWKLDQNGPRRDARGSYEGTGEKTMKWIPPSGSYMSRWEWWRVDADKALPFYSTDLNACAEFPIRLTENQLGEYEDALYDNGGYHATALQRCEAFLKVKGKWTV